MELTINVEMSSRQKLVFEACTKIQLGEKMLKEGRLELASLLGEKPKSSKKTAGQKSAETKRKKTIAHKSVHKSSFRPETRTDEQIGERVIALVKKHGDNKLTSSYFKDTTHVGYRRIENILAGLRKSGKLIDNWTGSRHSWALPGKKVTNGVNGHTNGVHKVRRSGIDVTDQSLVDKALKFIGTNDWVNKGQIIDAIDLSPTVTNRLIEHLQKQKLVKQVRKTQNPAHKSIPKMFSQNLPYWEVV